MLTVVSLLFMAPLLAESLTSQDNHVDWRPLGLRGQVVTHIAATGDDNEHIIYAETATGLWRCTLSASATCRWENIDAGLPRNILGAPALVAWRVVPGRPRDIYALTGEGSFRQLYHTADGGGHWRSVGPAPGQDPRPALAVLPGLEAHGDWILLGARSRIQRSSDGGTAWFPGNSWLQPGDASSDAQELVSALLAAGSVPDRLYVLTAAGRVWQSDSGGFSWQALAPGAPSVTALAVAPSDDSHVWAASAAGLTFSPDGGASWNLWQTPARMAITALAPDVGVAETLYAAVSSGEVYRSDSSGATWTSLGRPGAAHVSALALDAGSRGVLYAATRDGVWVRNVTPLQPTPTPTPTATPTFTLTPAATATPPSSATPTATATNTPLPTATPTPTATSTPMVTLVPTATRRPTQPPTATATATPPWEEPVAPAPPDDESMRQPSVVPPTPWQER